ncbi:MAG: maltokinase N-terminal cap-like domain-containing protein [Mycobacteriales bacterium]
MKLGELLKVWMPEQRWFAGKGRVLSTVDTRAIELSSDPLVELHLVYVVFSDGGKDTFIVPLSRRSVRDEQLERVLVGELDEEPRWVYDAMRDRQATPLWLDLFAARHEHRELRFHLEPGATVPLNLPGDIVSTEQSNSSLVFGDSAILKLFRRLEPGLNPDVEIHDALHARKNPHVAPLLGFLAIEGEKSKGQEDGTIAMLQTFLPAASDGWSLAAASIRDLYAEGDLHPDEVGGDFASESYRLGGATASVHADLAAVLPTGTIDGDELGGVVAGMSARLDAALDVVPELASHAEGLRACFAELAELAEPIPVQRVHGDYHLGQVLRTYQGWTILDFEGEPARPLAARRGLDSPLRDIAGMLRSFDYAARHLLVEGHTDPQLDYRANEWAGRNRQAFCDGYAKVTGSDPGEQAALLRAFEADKAVYEAVYEARNRPHWLPIPLASLARLAQPA